MNLSIMSLEDLSRWYEAQTETEAILMNVINDVAERLNKSKGCMEDLEASEEENHDLENDLKDRDDEIEDLENTNKDLTERLKLSEEYYETLNEQYEDLKRQVNTQDH